MAVFKGTVHGETKFCFLNSNLKLLFSVQFQAYFISVASQSKPFENVELRLFVQLLKLNMLPTLNLPIKYVRR